jgi:alkylation response protein AidB-like acyl-CoA dehydrogenase
MYLDTEAKLSEDQILIKDQAHIFAKDVMRSAGLALDLLSPEEVIAKESRLWDVYKLWYGSGQHSFLVPTEDNPTAFDPLVQSLVMEELGWGSSDLAISLGVASFPFVFAARWAKMSGDQRLYDEIVAPYLSDRNAEYIGCWAITEPEHGSDSLAVGVESFNDRKTAGACRAKLQGNEWIISGQKSAWVSNGTIATHALLFCTIDPDAGMSGGGVAVIPLDRDGVKRGAPLNKLGQRALNQGEIYFDDVHIPDYYMIAHPDIYPVILDFTLATANAAMGIIFTGTARAAFEEALSYAKVRVQGGKPISRHQMIQSKLFRMFAKVESARHLARSVIKYNAQADMPYLPFSIASKTFCTQSAFDVASDAIQVFGGMGLAKGTVVEKLFRDTRSALIEDGVNEFLELVGANKLLESYNEQ